MTDDERLPLSEDGVPVNPAGGTLYGLRAYVAPGEAADRARLRIKATVTRMAERREVQLGPWHEQRDGDWLTVWARPVDETAAATT